MTYDELVTANIKAFLRPEKLKNTLEHVVNAGIQRIIVGYDGPKELLEEHKSICDKYKDEVESLIFKSYEFNLGLSAVRNRMIDLTKTDFILLLDDDQYVPENVLGSVRFFDLIENLGGIGFGWILPGKFDIDAHDIKLINGYYVRIINGEKDMKFLDGHTLIYPFDFIPNSAIFRKAIFKDIRWDEAYKINREHEDFFLEHKRLGKWKFGIDLNVWIYHDLGGDREFSNYRKGIEAKRSVRYFRQKWQLKGIVGNPRYLTKLFDSYGYLMYAVDHMKKLVEKAAGDRVEEADIFLY